MSLIKKKQTENSQSIYKIIFSITSSSITSDNLVKINFLY